MRMFSRVGWVLLLALAATPVAAQEDGNLVRNGGFEQGESGWMWQQWRGRPLPGYIDRDDMHEGLASFKLHEEGREQTLWMAREVRLPEGEPRDYVLSLALKAEGLPDGAARVRVLTEPGGWVGRASGRIERVRTGGTHDWRVFQSAIPASDLRGAEKLTIFIYHDRPDTGTLGIDAVSVAPGTLEGQDAAAAPQAPAAEAPAPAPGPAAADDSGNLVDNGGFEQGTSRWMWQQWRGRPLPGVIDREDAFEGQASFRLFQADTDSELSMGQELGLPEGEPKDLVLSLALKPQNMPDNAARVRILLQPGGWVGRATGRLDRIRTGGTHDWRVFTTTISANELRNAQRLSIFIYHDKPNQGTLGIDAVSLKPADAAGQPQGRAPQPALPAGRLTGVSYDRGAPAILLTQNSARLAVKVSSEQAIYRVGQLPQVSVEHIAAPGHTLAWRVQDGFGNVLGEQSAAADQAGAIPVTLPPGHGYYEIIATLAQGDDVRAEARRSVGALTEPAEPVGDEPFGLWIQGAEHYPELGVRWVREGVYWQMYQSQGEAYLQNRIELFERYRRNNIKVMAYPKHPHPHQTSREVIADTPEAWRDLEAWWSKMVEALGPHVDAWGVVNEPIAGHWEGTNDLIMRYWSLMRRIVDRYDAGTPLVGASLGLAPSNVAQYQQLLQMGFADLVDAVEVHTYITSPEDMDLAGQVQRLRDMTRQASGRDLPFWSTEHGSSALYETELVQARHLMRSWLVFKKMHTPVVIWHMFSHPQGSDMREVHFGIFRNGRERGSVPQPRPAGHAYGVATRQLAGAVYKTELDYLGPSVNAYVFERNGQAMVALWTTSQRSFDVTLAVGEQRQVTQTGMFGRVEPLAVQDGLVRVTVDRDPKFIAPLPAFYLQSEPIARLDKAVAVLPGGSDRATLTLTNPTPNAAKVRIEWLPTTGWRFEMEQTEWTLAPQQSVTVPVTATASAQQAIGHAQVHAKVFLDGRYVAAMPAQATVLPQVTVADAGPGYVNGRPAVTGTLRRIDADLDAAVLQLSDGRSQPMRVSFSDRDATAFAVPVNDVKPGRLENLHLIVRGSQDKEQLREGLRLSFAPATYINRPLTIDGDLGDWPDGPMASDDPAMTVRWGWDEQHLYLAVSVDNPTHIQRQPVNLMWREDSLQIGLAPLNEEQLVRPHRPGLQEADMMELDLGLRPDGPAMYRHRTMNQHLAPPGQVSREQLDYAVRHEAGRTTYELRIPVEQVGLKPVQRGQVLRVSLLANTTQGEGRQTREWFGGIVSGKDPTLFGHLVLTD